MSLILLAGCGNKNAVQENPQKNMEMTVETAIVQPSDAGVRKEYPFIAKPFRTSELSFRVSGPVNEFESYSGNYYRKGSAIAGIDQRDFRLRKEQTEAVFRRTKAEYERMESLFKKDNISASTYEKIRAEYITAKINYETAVNDLADTRLTAPFDGYVGEVYIERFQDVRASQPVVSFVDISKLRVEVFVTQDVAVMADSLHNVSLSFDHQPDKVYNAQVVECARSTTSNNLSYLLTVMLPNPNGEFSAGMSGKVFFDIRGEKSSAVQIPQTALCHQPTYGDYVWVVSDNKVSRRSVVPGTMLADGKFSVVSGLQQNETVAVSGLRFLSEGMTVKLDDRPRVQLVANSINAF